MGKNGGFSAASSKLHGVKIRTLRNTAGPDDSYRQLDTFSTGHFVTELCKDMS